MIVNEGCIWATDVVSAALPAAEVHLQAVAQGEDYDLTIGDLVEPVWAGYAPVTLGALGAAAITADGVARAIRVSPCVFTNGSGATVTVYGFWIDVDGILYDYTEFPVAITIEPSQDFDLYLNQYGIDAEIA